MTTKEVHQAVRNLFSNYDHPMFNSFIFEWESDFFALSTSGYSVEVEVKVSRADFKKDFNCKTEKHKIFAGYKKPAVCIRKGWGESYKRVFNIETKQWEKTEQYSWVDWAVPCEKLPNKFFYACPEGLIKPEEVPAYAGLIYTQKADIMKPSYWIVKPAPFLHKVKRCFDKVLLGKYYYRNNEVLNELHHFLRQENLTEDQDKRLTSIANRLR